MGAYSYYLKGGVFANAETANMLLLALGLAGMDWNAVVSVLIPILTFFVGSFISQVLLMRLGEKRWVPLLLAISILMLAFLAILPGDTPYTIFHVGIAFIGSMQFNTFREARGVAMSTLFCTAHLRGCAASLASAVVDDDKKALKKTGYHGGLIATFILGAFLCAKLSQLTGTRTIAFAIIPIVPVLVEVLRNDRT